MFTMETTDLCMGMWSMYKGREYFPKSLMQDNRRDMISLLFDVPVNKMYKIG